MMPHDQHCAIEDMAERWMHEVLEHSEEPFSDQDRVHCQLFALLYIGRSLDAIDSRLMHMETLLRGMYDKEHKKCSWNSLMREINDRWRNRYGKQ